MAYAPGFLFDVFISYAHTDELDDAWVSRLYKLLKRKLPPLLGRGLPEIFFDEKRLKTGNIIKATIQEQLAGTAVFVAGVSRNYLDSDYCVAHELAWFREHTQGRLLQLLRMPLRDDQQMPVPGDKYLSLFQGDAADFAMFDPDSKRFEKAVASLASDIAFHLEAVRRARQAVYLNQPDLDQAQDPVIGYRDQLRKEFHGQGYNVEPVAVFTRQSPDTQIRSILDRADVTIHLFGDSSDPLVRRQFELARLMGKPRIVAVTDASHLAGLEGEDLPFLLGSSDWRGELLKKAREKLQGVRGSSAGIPLPPPHNQGSAAGGLA